MAVEDPAGTYPSRARRWLAIVAWLITIVLGLPLAWMVWVGVAGDPGVVPSEDVTSLLLAVTVLLVGPVVWALASRDRRRRWAVAALAAALVALSVSSAYLGWSV